MSRSALATYHMRFMDLRCHSYRPRWTRRFWPPAFRLLTWNKHATFSFGSDSSDFGFRRKLSVFQTSSSMTYERCEVACQSNMPIRFIPRFEPHLRPPEGIKGRTSL